MRVHRGKQILGLLMACMCMYIQGSLAHAVDLSRPGGGKFGPAGRPIKPPINPIDIETSNGIPRGGMFLYSGACSGTAADGRQVGLLFTGRGQLAVGIFTRPNSRSALVRVGSNSVNPAVAGTGDWTGWSILRQTEASPFKLEIAYGQEYRERGQFRGYLIEAELTDRTRIEGVVLSCEFAKR